MNPRAKGQVDKITTNSFEETQIVGQKKANEILAQAPQQTAAVLALKGDLGSGKTTFLQGFAQGLGIEEVVNSPTFVIMKKFKIQKGAFACFYHLDLYRLEDEKDLEFLNLPEIIKDPQNIIAIEWPEKISNILPQHTIWIHFNHLKNDQREISFGK